MILVDTSIWIYHWRFGIPTLPDLLERKEVLAHPFVIGELALGGMPGGKRMLETLLDLPAAILSEHEEVLAFIDRHALAGSGIGYGDAHLLASTRLTPGARLWTRDRRLLAVARRLGLDADIEPYSGFQED